MYVEIIKFSINFYSFFYLAHWHITLNIVLNPRPTPPQLFSTRPLSKILKEAANNSKQEEEINALFFDPNFTGKEVQNKFNLVIHQVVYRVCQNNFTYL